MSTLAALLSPERLLAAAAISVAALHAQPSVQITSPANGAQVSPGQSLAVTLNASGVSAVVVAIGSLGFASVNAPPYQVAITIPATATPKMYTLNVTGYNSQGQESAFATIKIDVRQPDAPVSLSVWPPNPDLDLGDVIPLHVTGTYSDGSTADISQATNTSYVSNNISIATVSQYGQVTAVAAGSTVIVINGTLQVPLTVAPPMKIAPLQKALYAGQSQQFYPTLADASVPSVSWSLNPSLGTVSGTGLYTAPSSITSQQTVVLTATSTANNTISAQSTITLLPQLAMSLSPSSVNLFPSQTVQFYASLSNTVNYGLNWSLNPNVGPAGTRPSRREKRRRTQKHPV